MAQDFDQWLALASHVGVAGVSPIVATPQWNAPCTMTPRQWARFQHAQRVQAARERRLSVSRPNAEVGWVMDSEIDSFDSSLRTLRGDAASLSTSGKALSPDALQAVISNIDALAAEWRVWVENNTGMYSRATGEDGMASFRSRYQELRGYLVRLGAKVTAPEEKVGSGGASKFSVPWWIWPVGLAALAIVFIGPAVVPMLLTKKAAGTALAVV